MWPLWAPSGRELFYVAGSLGRPKMLMAVTVKPSAGTFDWEAAKPLFDPDLFVRNPSREYDIARDGRFIMTAVAGASSAPRASLTVVEHWFDELAARVK